MEGEGEGVLGGRSNGLSDAKSLACGQRWSATMIQAHDPGWWYQLVKGTEEERRGEQN